MACELALVVGKPAGMGSLSPHALVQSAHYPVDSLVKVYWQDVKMLANRCHWRCKTSGILIRPQKA